MEFVNPTVAKISAKITGETSKITIDGVTADTTTVENAKAQIDKLMNVVSKSVDTDKMTRTIIQEAE